MKILQVHNYYSSAVGGEETMPYAERELLQGRVHSVQRFEVSNEDANLASLRAGVEMMWSPRSYREMREAIKRTSPHLVHFHNTFVRLSPSVYWTDESLEAYRGVFGKGN